MKKENVIKLVNEVFDIYLMVILLEYLVNKVEFDSLLVDLKKMNDLYYEIFDKLKMLR